MKTIAIKNEIKLCSYDELDTASQHLIDLAVSATKKSYAPYSHFNVGAALLLEDGTVIQGANQENAAFSVTVCAERAAIFNAQSNHPEQPVSAIAIAARNADGLVAEPVTPCGMCRQAMLEMEQRYHNDLRVYLYGTRGIYVIDSVKTLLPLCFTDDNMH